MGLNLASKALDWFRDFAEVKNCLWLEIGHPTLQTEIKLEQFIEQFYEMVTQILKYEEYRFKCTVSSTSLLGISFYNYRLEQGSNLILNRIESVGSGRILFDLFLGNHPKVKRSTNAVVLFDQYQPSYFFRLTEKEAITAVYDEELYFEISKKYSHRMSIQAT
jgi:hypothetical protein